jgi:hypothetical protein
MATFVLFIYCHYSTSCLPADIPIYSETFPSISNSGGLTGVIRGALTRKYPIADSFAPLRGEGICGVYTCSLDRIRFGPEPG